VLDVVDDAMPAPRSTFRCGHPTTLKNGTTFQCGHPRRPETTRTINRRSGVMEHACLLCHWRGRVKKGNANHEIVEERIASLLSASHSMRPSRLATTHPALAEYIATLPAKMKAKIEQSFSAATSPSHAKRGSSHSLWELAGRIPTETFMRFVENSSSLAGVVPALVALPVAMLVLPAAADRRSYTGLHPGLLPRPSSFFPGIAATLDMTILRASRHHDVELLAALAQVPHSDQPVWLERALAKGVPYARRLAAAPAWARVFIEVEPAEAARIWEALCCVIQSITYDRPNADPTALAQMTGAQVNWIGGLTFNADPTRTRWRSAFLQAGFALEHGQATLADFVFNQTGRGAPWTRW
jgi:hypothetical protein